MKPSRLHCLRVFVFVLAAVSTTEATSVAMNVKAVYTTDELCKAQPPPDPVVTPPVLVTAAKVDTCPTKSWDSTCPLASGLSTATTCSTTDGTSTGDVVKLISSLFGSFPYVVLEEYSTTSCTVDTAVTITTYLADGKCHKYGQSKGYRAARKSDGSTTIQLYTNEICTIQDTTAGGTKTTASTQSTTCANKIKAYGTGVTPFYLTSTRSYDSSTGECKSPTLPNQIKTSISQFDTTCLSTDACASEASFTSTTCSSMDGYDKDLATIFKNNPYIVAKTYTTSACSDLASSTVYLADGKCHKAGTKSYRAAFNADNSVYLMEFTDTQCSVGGTSVTQEADGTAPSCTNNKKVYGYGTTPYYYMSTKTFDSTTGNCAWPAIPSLVSTTIAQNDATCQTTSICTAVNPTSTKCSLATVFKGDMSDVFLGQAYVIVEAYATASSSPCTKLTGITSYLADGKCHKKGSKSYVSVVKADNSVFVTEYNDAACTTSSSTVQDTDGRSPKCTNDKMVYGFGLTPKYLTLTKTFDSSTGSCKAPTVPSMVTKTQLDYTYTCKETTACTSATVFTSTACSSVPTYEADMATVFGSQPYAIVKTFASGSCNELTGVDAYIADGKCHKVGARYYQGAVKADMSVKVSSYSDAACSLDESVVGQDTDGSKPKCSSDKMVYGFGLTPFYLTSVKKYNVTTAAACVSKLMPIQVATSVGYLSTCTVAACDTTTTPYSSTVCGTVSTYKADMAAIFGSNPYIIVETYNTDKQCDSTQLKDIITYLADGRCMKTGPSNSYRAAVNADGSTTIITYGDDKCGGNVTPIQVGTVDQIKYNLCISDTLVYAFGVTPLVLKSTKTYKDTATSCNKGGAVEVTTTPSNLYTCQASTGCDSTVEPITSVVCSSLTAYKSDMSTAFGTTPFVIVQTFNNGKQCAATDIVNVATYVADGSCHAGETTSYAATRAADGSAVVIAYDDTACTTQNKLLSVSAAQAKGNSCANDVNGIIDTKVDGNGNTKSMYKSTMSFDSNVNACKAPGVPTQVVTTAGTSCSATSSCSGTSDPYTSTACTSILTYKADIATVFGSNPYVVMEFYSADENCASGKLTNITTYLADGKCHKTGAKTSYVATRDIDGSAGITTYADSATCASDTGKTITVDANQVSSKTCVEDTLVYGGGVTPLYLTSTKSYKIKNCTAPAVPTRVVTTIGKLNNCQVTDSCTGTTAPYTSTQCSSVGSYKADIAATFGSFPYSIIESYTPDKKCDPAELSGITTYLADGACYKTGTGTSYQAYRSADSSTTIISYSDEICSTMTDTKTVTANMAKGNSCADDEDGIVDTKVYGAGVTPWYVTSTATYADTTNNCGPPGVPIEIVSTVAPKDTCKPTTTCGDSASSIVCSSLSTYKADMATAFGSSPYVIVKKYSPNKQCAISALKDIAVYLANGACQATGESASYIATRGSDGSIVIITYDDTAKCDSEGDKLTATAAQATGNSCSDDGYGIPDTKVSGSGVTPTVYSSLTSYDTTAGACKSPTTPTLVSTTVGNATTCATSNTCSDSGTLFTGSVCTSILTYKADMEAVFGGSPFVIVEKYEAGKQCAASTLSGITTYLADGECHTTGPAASYVATRTEAGVAEVQMFTDSAICNSTATIASATADQGHTCVNDGKVSGGGSTPVYLSLSKNYDSSTSCTGMPTQITAKVVEVDDCLPTTNCTGTTAPFTSTTCASSETFEKNVAVLFGTSPYVVVETYDGQGCVASDLTGAMVYWADGKCHKTATKASYQAARKADGSANVILYTDSPDCSTEGDSTDYDSGCSSGINVYGDGVTPLFLKTVKTFKSTGCAVTNLVEVATTVGNVETCKTSACSTASPYQSTACSTLTTFKTAMDTAFGSNPYVIVQRFNKEKQCVATELSSITAYLADGTCRSVGGTYYKATRAVDGAAAIVTYSNSECSADRQVMLSVTAAQAKGNSCVNDENGIADVKVDGNGKTSIIYTSKSLYDTNVGGCQSPVVPTQVSTSSTTSCTTSTACTGTSAPYTGTSCTSVLTYNEDMKALFGKNPYIILESYTEDKICSAAGFLSVTTYLADGKCHATSATSSYKATISAVGVVAISTYPISATCTGGVLSLSVTGDEVRTNSCTGKLLNKKIYSQGTTPRYYQTTMSFDTISTNCQSSPVQLSTIPVDDPGACKPTTTCTGLAPPYTGITCSSRLTFKDDVAALFRSNAYVVVESYSTAGECASGTLPTGMETYLADGKCHRIGKLKSYIATRQIDGAANIVTYTDPWCQKGANPAMTAASNQEATYCDGSNRLYGEGATPLYLSSTVSYDTNSANCKSPGVPVHVSSTPVDWDECSAVATCTGQVSPYTVIGCGSTDTYGADLSSLFGSSPYVVVESYAEGKSCESTKLLGIMAYLADGKCHATGATASYTATRALDGSATITTFTDSGTCTTEGVTFTITAAQARGNTCTATTTGIIDKKVHGKGITPTSWSAVSLFDGISCSKPTQLTMASQSSCTPYSCLELGSQSLSYGCSNDYFTSAKDVFASSPYVVVELFEDGSECKTMEGVVAYAADSSCHLTIDGLTSFTVMLSSDGSGKVMLYDDTLCNDATPATILLTASQLSSNLCVGSSKYFAVNAPPPTQPSTTAPSVATKPPTTTAPSTTAPATNAPAPTPVTTTSTGSGQSGAVMLSPVVTSGLALLGWVLSLLL